MLITALKELILRLHDYLYCCSCEQSKAHWNTLLGDMLMHTVKSLIIFSKGKHKHLNIAFRYITVTVLEQHVSFISVCWMSHL